jgi:hypothetical protein
MASGYEITCANRNPNGMIVRIGGASWSLGLREAITKLVTHQIRFFILIDGSAADVGIRGEGSDAYLVIEPDGYPLDKLIQLASC